MAYIIARQRSQGMRSAFLPAAFLAAFFSLNAIASAGSVEVSLPPPLGADVNVTLGDPANPADSKESHDTGALSKRDVTAQATASVPIESSAFTGSGAADAHLTSSDDGFVLTG